MWKNKFILGLITALILGFFVNVFLGYGNKSGRTVNKDIKDCKELASGVFSFGNLKLTVLGNGRPVENLEVDVSTKPGPIRCMQRTDKNGTVLFSNVPVGRMAVYFNNASFPKDFGRAPTEWVEIVTDKTLEKTIELKQQ